ncbi:uncharacterized protein TRIADDRAFT_27025, partial [Trichoplax adhaerens]
NLPAVLNDPRGRRETDFFTKTWGEEFVPPSIIPPSHYVEWIDLSDFNEYRSKIAHPYKIHKKNKKSIKGGIGSKKEDSTGDGKVFLEPKFALEDPDTFNAVLPWSQFENAAVPDKDISPRPRASAKLLQEKLTHYLDIAEVELARQISLKSEDFFNAMSSQDDVVDRVAYTCAEIRILREKLMIINEILCKSCLEVLKLKCCRARSATVFHKLKLMGAVHQTQPMIQVMLSSSDYVGALDLIATTQDVLQQELSGIQSFRHLGSQLTEMEKVIVKMMEANFVELIAKELNKPIEKNSEPTIVDDEDRLLSVLFGLLRQKKLNFLNTFREESFNAIKATVKQKIIEILTTILGNSDLKLNNLTEHVRQLNFPQWIDMLQHIFSNILIILHRIKSLHDLVMEIAGTANKSKSKDCDHDTGNTDSHESDRESIEGKTSNISEKFLYGKFINTSCFSVVLISDTESVVNDIDHEKIINDSKELLCAACELSHVRLAKLLGIRAKDDCLERLTSSDFMVLIRSIHQFIAETEGICGRQMHSLSGTLMAQARKFVEKFHDERRTKISLILDNEQWKQADVPPEFQALVDELDKDGIAGAIQKISRQNVSTPSDSPLKVLVIKGEKYAVIGTLLILLKMAIEYCECINDVPMLTLDMINKVAEILKLFNSRTCQLVLGAGALQVVGLRTITSKHLALAYRCLQVMTIYIPQIKTYFQSMLPPKKHILLTKFDHLLQDYQNHCQEIDSKLISIMDTVFFTQLGKWEVKAPTPSQCFRGMIKQVAKLHDALSDLLPKEHVKDLFDEIMNCFISRLKVRLTNHEISDDGGSQHGLVTSELLFFVNSLQGFDGLSNINEKINNVWKEMQPKN